MTKQEQIEKIQEIINDCYEVDSFIAAEGSEGGYIDTEEAAKAIIEAGYGDVSEYKAEIEKLKEETSNIRKDTAKEFATRICEMLWNLGIDGSGNRFSYGDLTSENVLYVAKQFGVDIDDRLCKENNMATSHINKLVEQDAEIKKLKQQVKQAKIDVLSKLKTFSHCDNFFPDSKWHRYVFVNYIDRLIEEIENDEERVY